MSQRDALADDVLRDLRGGMDDIALMDKYQLSYVELRNLYLELFNSGRLLQSQPDPNPTQKQEARRPRPPILERSSTRREIDRYRLYFDIPVYELDRPEVVGAVCDVTENGIGVIGVEAELNEVKTLVVEGDTFCDVAPFEIQVRCCWIEKRAESDEVRAGFEITDMSEYDRRQLDKLIELAVA
ncbi:MAG: PilZ domain-containing protein [Desulfomonile sp.]|nr:PilZ domain-containing protein [Desulfomonile sp.]